MESAEDRCLVSEDDDDDDATTIDVDEAFTKSRIIYADEIPTDEECLEIQDSPEDFCITFKTEPMDGLISPIPSHTYEHLKSPLNTLSDCGYESHGSPLSLQDFPFNNQQEDINYLLNDLFPALA